ncbi:MAG TPA: NAD-dependent DNA ligase LigA [Phycisphaerae bacterium]|nr:NAD-dependent DNA ligase LigA [Phycisphaerae bacterium]
MSRQNISQEIDTLRDDIRRHDELYYSQAKPEISDQEYDALMRRLIELEAAHPDLVTPDSPSQRVGGNPIEGFESVRHAVRMMSIDNTYTESEIRDFDDRVKRLLGTDNYRYTCEPKIDGVSLSLRYEDGLLVTAATRGDGVAGDNVTSNARTIRNIPLRLRAETQNTKRKTQNLFDAASDEKTVVEVRGEVFIPREQFARINKLQEEMGLEAYANPRNTAAGTLKQLDPKVVAARKLEFLPHGSGEIRGLDVKTYHEWQEDLRKFGFRTNEHFRCCDKIDDVLKYIHEFAETRKSLPYDTDGVVIKVDRFDQRDQMGVTSKAPRWCIAYKYQPEQAETELVEVRFQVGKTGTLTPVGEFSPPVFISGTNVYRASLHNFDEVERKDIHLHDRVIVEKAGEVIPYVVGVVKEKRPENAKKISRPKKCPSCGSEDLEHDGGFVRCVNPNCPAQLAERLRFWTGRNQMDIAEIGPAVIDVLLKPKGDTGGGGAGVKGIGDLYRLRASELKDLVVSEYEKTDEAGGAGKDVKVTIGEKRAANIVAGIEASKERGLAKLLAGLGILNIGVRTGQLVAQHFGSLDKLREASLADILQAPEMGGGMLKDIEKLRERYPEVHDLTVEQLMGATGKRGELSENKEAELKALPARRAHEKSPWELIEQLRGRGVAAKSLYDFLHSDAGKKTLDELISLGLKVTEDAPKRSGNQPLAGMTVVVTGTLSKFTRGEIKKKIEELGGKTSETVSKSTTFVLAGDEAGSKLEKAKKLGVEVLDESAFIRRLGES